jgi:putative ABC transport system permease protein
MSMGNETIAHRERRRQVIIVGTTPEFLEINQLRVAAGQSLPRGEMDRGAQLVLLGGKVAEELFPGEQAVGRVVRVGDWRMRVQGVLARRGTRVGFDLDDFAIVPVATGMRIFNRSSLFRIMLEMNAYTEMDQGCARVLEIISARHDEEDVTCITQESVVSSLSTILNVLTLALGGIAAVSLSVAGIGIMNLMLVSVSERTQEVGLLKAVGAGRGQILAVFLAEAVLIATLGGLLGLLIAWLGIWVLVTIYPTFPAQSPLWAVVAALLTSLGVGALFGVLPARRAADLDPVAALAGR